MFDGNLGTVNIDFTRKKTNTHIIM